MPDLVFFDAAWAPPVVAWLSTYALHSTLLLGAAWLAACWLPTARAQDVLWKTALVAGVLTASVQVALVQETRPDPVSAVVVHGTAAGERVTLQADRIVVHGGAAAPVVIERAPAAPASDSRGGLPAWTAPDLAMPSGMQRWALVLVGFWLLGVAIEGLRRVRTHRRFMASLGDRARVEERRLQAEVGRLAARAGLRYPLRLTQSDALAVPVALGVDEVVLPVWAVAEASPSQQRAMLAHEVAHLARRDPFWLAAFAAMESLFFFQPLNVLARRRQQAAAERLCDAWAADAAGPLAMARSLVDAAGQLRAQREAAVLPHLVPGMAVRGASLNDRVAHLLDGSGAGARRRWPVLVAALCVVGLVACAGPAVTSSAPAPETAAAAPTPPTPPVPPTAPVPPTPPVPRTPSVAPVPPTPPVPPVTAIAVAGDTSDVFTYVHTDDGRRLRIEREGTVTYEDGLPVALSEGGRLLIEEDLDDLTRRYEARGTADGLGESYEVNGDVRPLDADGRRWLRDRVEEMQGLKPPPPPAPPGSSAAWEDYERRMSEYAAQMERFADEMEGTFSEDYERQMADYERQMEAYAAQMTRFAIEMKLAYGPEFAARMEAMGTEFEARGRALEAQMRTRAEELRRLTEELERTQDPERRAELERRLRERSLMRFPTGQAQSSEALRNQADELEREAERMRQEAERMRQEAERQRQDAEQRRSDDG